MKRLPLSSITPGAQSDESSGSSSDPASASTSRLSDASREYAGSVARNPREKVHLKCPHISCTRKGTFPRTYELEWHIRVKHDGNKPFACPFPGCFKGTTAPSYSRSDKLTSHIRNVHSRHLDKLLDCCVEGCTSTPLPIDLLGAHICHAHSGWCWSFPHYHIDDERARALHHAGSRAYRQCPLWRCAKLLRLTSFMAQLQEHTRVELSEVVASLASEGYQIVETSTLQRQSERQTKRMTAFLPSKSTSHVLCVAKHLIHIERCRNTLTKLILFLRTRLSIFDFGNVTSKA